MKWRDKCEIYVGPLYAMALGVVVLCGLTILVGIMILKGG